MLCRGYLSTYSSILIAVEHAQTLGVVLNLEVASYSNIMYLPTERALK